MTPQRIAIMGNAGSGKTYLAKALASAFNIPHIALDDIFWADRFYANKRDPKEVERLIVAQREKENWIVEGVYGEFIELFLPRLDMLIWLDMSWELCKEALQVRHLQQPDKVENFDALLAYAEQYWQRDNMRSFAAHQQLYEGFGKKKFRFQTRLEVNEYVGSF